MNAAPQRKHSWDGRVAAKTAYGRPSSGTGKSNWHQEVYQELCPCVPQNMGVLTQPASAINTFQWPPAVPHRGPKPAGANFLPPRGHLYVGVSPPPPMPLIPLWPSISGHAVNSRLGIVANGPTAQVRLLMLVPALLTEVREEDGDLPPG